MVSLPIKTKADSNNMIKGGVIWSSIRQLPRLDNLPWILAAINHRTAFKNEQKKDSRKKNYEMVRYRKG